MLRVCTWNINLGLRLDKILEAVTSRRDFAGLDLFALQEASEHDGRTDGIAIAAALGPDYECHQVTAQTVKGRVQANAMIWRGRKVRVRNVDYLTLPRSEKTRLAQTRNSVVVEGEVDRKPLLAYSIHLDIFGAAHKQGQLEHVLADCRNRPDADITVVAGDLNLYHLSRWPSWSKLIDAYQAAGFVDAAGSVRWTHSIPRLRVRQKLDSILVRSSRELEMRSWTLQVDASDHMPLFADLATR
ncbi:MAG TPA: endonuclease/exonuclease/phosphatase family protein [Candidatus Dormibacteraeota bacterium]|nr:endonuclease/exonuclease/phosphatase family protein [Candidatus Dormibacteraeota bacterium]